MFECECRAVGCNLAASLAPLAYRENVVKVFSAGTTLVVVHLSRLNWFQLPILMRGPLVNVIVCMIFLSPFLHTTRMPMPKVSFLMQLDSKIICL